jgi:hypothetical protein
MQPAHASRIRCTRREPTAPLARSSWLCHNAVVIELFALWVLGRRVAAMADAKRRDRGWAALVFLAWVLVELLVWRLGRSLGLAVVVAYPLALVAGAAAGLGAIAWLRSLPPLPVFDPRVYDRTWSEGTCPRCGSEQTYPSATTIRCFSCEYYGKPSQGRPKPARSVPATKRPS